MEQTAKRFTLKERIQARITQLQAGIDRCKQDDIDADKMNAARGNPTSFVTDVCDPCEVEKADIAMMNEMISVIERLERMEQTLSEVL
jgi:hypothetical protein